MLGLQNSFPLFDFLMQLQLFVLLFSIGLLFFFIISKNHINKKILIEESNHDKVELSLLLIYANKGIENTCMCLIFSIILYCIFYIMI